MTPQQIAERCAEVMWPDDKAAQGLGIELVRVAPGEAVTRMTVRDDMVNGHDICHGGFIFALADSAFAYACNTFNVSPPASISTSSPQRTRGKCSPPTVTAGTRVAAAACTTSRSRTTRAT
mgnify:CR=1 FL=1